MVTVNRRTDGCSDSCLVVPKNRETPLRKYGSAKNGYGGCVGFELLDRERRKMSGNFFPTREPCALVLLLLLRLRTC